MFRIGDLAPCAATKRVIWSDVVAPNDPFQAVSEMRKGIALANLETLAAPVEVGYVFLPHMLR